MNPVWAQNEDAEGADGGDDVLKNTQNDVILVVGAGVAGAILGLSTLSFVEKPAKHLSNIWTGGALGVIAGVVFVAYNSAQRGQESIEEEDAANEEASVYFKTSERLAWHLENSQDLAFPEVQFGTRVWQMNF